MELLTYRNLGEIRWFQVLDPGYCRWKSPLETCWRLEPRMVHQQELDLMAAYVTFWHSYYVQENPQGKRQISTEHNPFDWADNFSQLSNKLSEESFGTETLFMALHIPSNKASGPTNILFIDPHGYSLRVQAAVLLKDLKPIQSRSRYSLTN